MDYDLIVVKTLERVYKNYYYIIRGRIHMTKFEVIAYETENGDNPVEKFLDKLNPKMRAKIFGMLVILQEKQLAKARRADYMERMKKL